MISRLLIAATAICNASSGHFLDIVFFINKLVSILLFLFGIGDVQIKEEEKLFLRTSLLIFSFIKPPPPREIALLVEFNNFKVIFSSKFLKGIKTFFYQKKVYKKNIKLKNLIYNHTYLQ